MRAEGFGQQPHLRENRLPVLIDNKVAGMYVEVGEHEAITAYLDRRQLLLGLGRERRVRLSQIPR